MTPEETRAAGRLGTHAAAGVVSHVQQVHAAVAGRVFRSVGPVGTPVRVGHDLVAGAVYGLVRGAGRVAGTAATEVVVAARRTDRTAAPLAGTVRGNVSMAALNAVAGPWLDRTGSPLAVATAVRVDGRDVPATAAALAAAFPAATGRLAVFLPGLTETEDAWRFGAGPQGGSYGCWLAADGGYTAVYLRYNTGLHISVNGRRLARLLTDLVAGWPVPVDEIALIGHSMGGLVARSGCHYGEQAGEPWVPGVRHVVYLGSPHLGATLERGAAAVGRTLQRLPETRPYAALVHGRSAGVKDLRYGYLTDEEWRDCDVDTCPDDHRADLPLLATANHYAVAATLTRDLDHPVGRIVGDLLVRPASAHGRDRAGRHIPFPVHHRRGYGGLHHFDLLNHPDVYAALRGWLTAG